MNHIKITKEPVWLSFSAVVFVQEKSRKSSVSVSQVHAPMDIVESWMESSLVPAMQASPKILLESV